MSSGPGCSGKGFPCPDGVGPNGCGIRESAFACVPACLAAWLPACVPACLRAYFGVGMMRGVVGVCSSYRSGYRGDRTTSLVANTEHHLAQGCRSAHRRGGCGLLLLQDDAVVVFCVGCSRWEAVDCGCTRTGRARRQRHRLNLYVAFGTLHVEMTSFDARLFVWLSVCLNPPGHPCGSICYVCRHERSCDRRHRVCYRSLVGLEHHS